jgi:anti-sigma B factor antagonist
MFEAVVSEEGNVRTIALNGECDLQLFPDVDELLRSSLSDGFAAVKVDLRGLTFIDSSGVRGLLIAKHRAESNGARFSIIPGTDNVMRVFELLGLLEKLPFEESFDRTRRPTAD